MTNNLKLIKTESKTDVQDANEAFRAFAKTTTGKWALSGMFAVVSILGYFGFVPERDIEIAQQAARTHYAQMLTDFKQQFVMLQDIRTSENLPERLQWDLVRLEGIAISNQAFGIAFMSAAQEMLPEPQYEQIHRQAMQDMDALKRELHEAATPTIPPTLQEKLLQIEEEHDAD